MKPEAPVLSVTTYLMIDGRHMRTIVTTVVSPTVLGRVSIAAKRHYEH